MQQKPEVSPPSLTTFIKNKIKFPTQWHQRYYFYIHIVYIVFVGFFTGLLVFIIELWNSKISFIDAISLSFDAVCITGLMPFDISLLSTASSVILFITIILGGLRFTTTPALIIKTMLAYKKMLKKRLEAIEPPSSVVPVDEEDRRHTFDISNYKQEFVSQKPWFKFRPPPPSDVEYLAHVRLLIIIIVFTGMIYFIGTLTLSIHFAVSYPQYPPENSTSTQHLSGKHPFWVGLHTTVSAFNNAGITLFHDSLHRFRSDYLVCIVVGILVMIGNTLYPAIIRFIIFICYVFGKRHKVVYKYLLDRHHHVSFHIFPGIQTRVYCIFTLLLIAVGVLMMAIMDFGRTLGNEAPGVKLLIAWFHSVSARTAGFTTIDISTLSAATLLIFIIFMRIKPQMFCSLTSMDPVQPAAVFRSTYERNLRSLKKKKQVDNEITDYISSLLNYNIINLEEKPTLYNTVRKIFSHTLRLLQKNNVWLLLVVLVIMILHHKEVCCW